MQQSARDNDASMLKVATTEMYGWDLDRELRVLRDAGARSRTEEANALRRSAEEVERCVVRRQLDEGDALQKFCAGFSGAFMSQLERHRASVVTRLEALEASLEGQADKLEKLLPEVASESRGAVSEAIDTLCHLLRQNGDHGVDGRRMAEVEGPSALQGAVARLNTELRTSFTGIVDRVAVGHLGAAALRMTDDISQLREDVKAVLEERCGELQNLQAGCGTSIASLQQRIDVLEQHQGPRLEVLENATTGAATKLEDMTRAADALQAHLSAVDDTTVVLKEAVRVCATEVRAATRAAEEHASTEAAACLGAASRETQEGLAALKQEVMHVARDTHGKAVAVENMAQALRDNLFQEVNMVLRRSLESNNSDLKSELQAALETPLEASLRSSLAGSLDARVAQVSESCRLMVKEAATHLETDHGRLNKQVQDLSVEVRASHGAAEDVATAVHHLSADLVELKGHLQAPTHTWTVQQCMRRLRSLSLAAEPGIWLDSPEFSLGPWQAVTLQLYPRGLRGGDGQVAVGILAKPSSRRLLRPQSVRLDATVHSSVRRAEFRGEDEAGVLWVASGLGPLETHVSQAEDLPIMVELLPGWSSEASPRSPEVASLAASSHSPGKETMPTAGMFASTSSLQRKESQPRLGGGTSPVASGAQRHAIEMPKARPVSARPDIGAAPPKEGQAAAAASAAAASAAGIGSGRLAAQVRPTPMSSSPASSPQAVHTPWSSNIAASQAAPPPSTSAATSWSGAIFDGFRRTSKEVQEEPVPSALANGIGSKNPFEETSAAKPATPHASTPTLSTNPFDDPAH